MPFVLRRDRAWGGGDAAGRSASGAAARERKRQEDLQRTVEIKIQSVFFVFPVLGLEFEVWG